MGGATHFLREKPWGRGWVEDNFSDRLTRRMPRRMWKFRFVSSLNFIPFLNKEREYFWEHFWTNDEEIGLKLPMYSRTLPL